MAKFEEIEGVPDFAQSAKQSASAAKFQEIDGTPPGFAPAKRQVSIGERAMAVPAGINRGFWADLPGIPVDAVANVIDLGKAAIGATAGGIGKLVGADPRTVEKYMPDITPRGQVVGSGEWIANQLNKGSQAVTGTRAFDNPNPEDAASRILFAGGRAAGGSVVPNPRAAIGAGQQAMNLGMGAASGLLGGGVAEINPEYAMLASFAPQIAKSGAAAATQRIVRGDEAGRQAMAQRIQDLQNAGIENPSAGLASGNKTIMGLENILSQTPGSVGVFQNSKDQVLSGIQNRVADIRNQISPLYGAVDAGNAIQKSLSGSFKDRLNQNQSILYNKVNDLIPKDSKVPVSNAVETLNNLTSVMPSAPNIGQRFVNGKISDINDAILLDTGLKIPQASRTITNASPSTPDVTVSLPGGSVKIVPGRDASSVTRTINPYYPSSGEGTWKPPAIPTLPYDALAKLRTQVGAELNNNSLASDVPRSQWKQLYGSLSQDMRNAAEQTSPQASQAFNRANDYSKAGISRLEDLDFLANASTPEKAYQSVAQSLQSGPTIWNKLRGPLTPDARKQVVSTIVDEMGRPPAGQQNADASSWSPSTFLTNYNRIAKTDPGAIENLFKRLPGGEQHAKNLQEVANAAEMLKDASKVWANPSGTSQALSNKATFGAIGLGLTGGLFYAPLLAAGATAGTGLASSAGMSRLLLNPQFVNWLAKAPNVKPQDQQAYALRMLANSRFSPDKQYQEDVKNYLADVANAQNGQQ